MSHLISTRRFSLFAGSSLAAANLSIAVVLGVAAAPTAALAQACTPTQATVSGPGADTVNCTGGSGVAGRHNPGITYQATGDLTVTTSGNITVSTTGGVPGARTPNGINLSATGSDSVTFISAAQGSVTGGSITAGAQTNGALIDVLTENGSILVTTGTLFADANGTTHGVFAQSTGAGAITIDATRGVSLSSSTSAANVSVAAIEARTTTGSILIEAEGNISGGRRPGAVGIITQSDGDVTVNLTNANLNGTLVGGIGTGVAMRAAGAGAVELNIDWTLPLGVTGGTYEAEQRGLGGSVDFSGLAGGTTINIGQMATWEVSGTANSVFGVGDDAVNIAAGGYILLRAKDNIDTDFDPPSTVAEDRYVIDFGGGDNRMTNAGFLLIGVDNATDSNAQTLFQPDRYEGELRLENLTTFENSGVIYLGAMGARARNAADPNYTGTQAAMVVGTDGQADDMLAMPGAHFIGSPGSRLLLDVNLNAPVQESCDASLRASNGDLPAADCIDLRGGSATGETLVTLGDTFPASRGSFNPNGLVIVDVAGGAAEPGAFVLDPGQAGYATAGDQGYYNKGLFAYVVGFDEETTQFKVYGVTSAVAQQYPLIATAAGDLWRAAASSWLEQRQAGLLGGEREPGLGGGVWMRLSGASVQRDVATSVTAGVATLDFDNSYDQRNLTLTVGVDALAGGFGGADWAIGAMAGYSRGEMEFDQSANVNNLEGAHAGVYGGLTAGAFFLDASLNGSWLTLDSDTPALNLIPAGSMVGGGVSIIGAQAEAGWRIAAGRLGIEPLASLSYAKTTMDDLVVPAGDPILLGGRVEFDDITSLRAGLGVRLSMEDVAPSFAPTRLSLTARALNETDGEVQASIANIGPFVAPVSDLLDGAFSEVVGAVSVSNSSHTAAGYVNVSGLFGSDYQSVGVSAGFRYQW